MSDVTRMLEAIDQGDPEAASRLLPLVYDELRRLAAGSRSNRTAGSRRGPRNSCLGAIVLAGAWKMRRLTGYRFCRISSMLAMLPLGFGFFLGLPFGFWALLVLRRSDVKAAFSD